MLIVSIDKEALDQKWANILDNKTQLDMFKVLEGEEE